jgi:8-oxo-dGTP diphosphatase
MQKRPEVHVTAGVLTDGEGRVLVAQRPVGKHLAGRWEFPGGKLNPGEAPVEGLKRELAEELGITLEAAEPLIRLRHDYHDRRVLLDVWRVTRHSGTPAPLDRQVLDWVLPDRLPSIDLLEADRPIITALRLPTRARCVSSLQDLAEAGRRKQPEALFWRPEGIDPAAPETQAAVRAARRAGHRVLIAGDGVEAAMTAAATAADGMLLEPTGARLSFDPGGSFLCGAICPTPAATEAAVRSGAHFLVLAPGAGRADERQFVPLLRQLGVPAYLGWYGDDGALDSVRSSGAHGCAIGPFPPRGG